MIYETFRDVLDVKRVQLPGSVGWVGRVHVGGSTPVVWFLLKRI